MNLTISDIARLSNVSKTTVSRFLNGKYEFMSENTRKKIQDVISKTNYKPNIIARSLKTKNAKIIGCTIDDMQNQFSSFIFKGISEVCAKKGYTVLVTEVNSNKNSEKKAIETLLSYNVDGLIINTTGCNDDFIINLSKSKKIPIVLADRSISKQNIIDTVTCNNYSATYDCMKYLKECGYKKVVFLTSNIKNNSVKKLRYCAYLDAMKSLFYIDNSKYTLINKFDVKKFIKTYHNTNTAIFCVNGVVLLEILKKVQDLGFSLQNEGIGICSFDDWTWQELLGITTIKQDSYRCGSTCANLLFERIKNPDKNIEYIEISTELIKRNSTERNVK